MELIINITGLASEPIRRAITISSPRGRPLRVTIEGREQLIEDTSSLTLNIPLTVKLTETKGSDAKR